MTDTEKMIEKKFEEFIAKLGIKRVKVSMTNIKTREDVDIKVGFSWILLFFSCAFGIPLYERKLYKYSFVFFAYWILFGCILYYARFINPDIVVITLALLNLMVIFLSIYLGFKGNEITAKNYLKQGFVFVNSYCDNVKYAKAKWRLNNK